MFKKSKKVLAALTALLLALSIAACGGGGGGTTEQPATEPAAEQPAPAPTEEQPATTEPATEEPATEEPAVETPPAELTRHEKIPERDLGGQEIIIGNWWGDWDANTYEPTGAADEASTDWRLQIQSDHNFTMMEKNVAGWGEMQELAATSILAGDPLADVILLEPRWFTAMYNQGLLAPLNVESVDITSNEFADWNQATIEACTFGGLPYGFSFGFSLSAGGPSGIYYNKRLFEEAGLDPDLPYNMQAEGTWTWENYIELCSQLTRDINNDGIMDTYAIVPYHDKVIGSLLTSNNAMFIGKDAEGKFTNATGTPEFLEGLQFSMRLFTEGYLMPQPEGSQWNWFNDAFQQGQGAMFFGEIYMRTESFLSQNPDDIGFVTVPVGPKGTLFGYAHKDNVHVIPATKSAEEVDDIMFATQLWYMPAPGYDDPEAWKSASYNLYSDSRAVDETLQNMRASTDILNNYTAYIPRADFIGDITWNLWFEDVDPATLIESVQQSWNSIVDETNAIE
ncbi:MAG: extracellular solute-binding protein [Clostridiales bacterium]|nr:extracellular solute-binding protein [Clostridiales bacterium]